MHFAYTSQDSALVVGVNTTKQSKSSIQLICCLDACLCTSYCLSKQAERTPAAIYAFLFLSSGFESMAVCTEPGAFDDKCVLCPIAMHDPSAIGM